MQQLRKLPLTELKIDRSFIFNIHEDSLNQDILNSMLNITKTLDIDLVAEGVECYKEMSYLSNLEEKLLLQGFFISRPKPLESLVRWHNSWLSAVKKAQLNPAITKLIHSAAQHLH